MTSVTECRMQTLEELLFLNKFEVLPLSILMSSFLLAKNSEFLKNIPFHIKSILQTVDTQALSNFHEFKKLIGRLDEQLIISMVKEIYLTEGVSEKIKSAILSFTLDSQIGITEMLGYYYDQDVDFLLDSINSEVTNMELKSLLIKRAYSKTLQKKLIECEHIYLSPSELLRLTNNRDLIVKYIFSRNIFSSQQHIDVFKDLLSKISIELYSDFKRKERHVLDNKKCEVIEFKK